jgi:hypothetical protein
MGDRIVAAVISEQDGKPITPQHIVTILPTEDDAEALFVAAIINSIPFQFAAYAYSQAGGKSFGTPEILEKVLVPKYNHRSSLYTYLSDLSQRAHTLAPSAYAGDPAAQVELQQIETEIDHAAARLWGLTDAELDGLRKALEELKGEDITADRDHDEEEV